jgi:hypothetical protein
VKEMDSDEEDEIEVLRSDLRATQKENSDLKLQVRMLKRKLLKAGVQA